MIRGTTRYSSYIIIVVALGLLSRCRQSVDSTTAQVKSYPEPHRGQVHFSPETSWMNDPNGMVYHDGEYHLFYQYYPDSTVWGPMHWGHAVSPDLIHWEHLPIALYPDSLGYIFSGSAVIDTANTAGFGKDAMVAIFTYHDMEAERSGESKTYQTQGIAYSLDNGRTFTKYIGNPVVPNPGIKDFRDPKVIWDQERSRWVMTFAAYDKVRFYTSPNLREWTYSGEFGIIGDERLWECPDLFPMRVEGSDELKWVLITSIQQKAPNGGTATSYFVGDFDGNAFVSDPQNQKWLDYGTDNYAFVTWANVPEEDGRILGIGWMSNWQYAQVVPTKAWRSAMTLPRSLELHDINGDYFISSTPVLEIENVRKKETLRVISDVGNKEEIEITKIPFLLELDYKNPTSNSFYIRFENEENEYVSIGYDATSQEYYIDRRNAGISSFSDVFAGLHTAPSISKNDSGKVIIVVDRASVELFAQNGFVTMTDIIFPSSPYDKIYFSTEEVSHAASLRIEELKSIWRE